MRGRKPKPREQRIREGMAGHRPLPERVMVSGRPIPAEIADPPEHLPAVAQEFWREYVPVLAGAGVIDLVDRAMLEQMAVQYARIRSAQRVIEHAGHYAIGSVGQIREHPAVKMEREATVLFMRLTEQFGLSPVARTRLGLAALHARSIALEIDEALEAGVIDGDVVDWDAHMHSPDLPPGLGPAD